MRSRTLFLAALAFGTLVRLYFLTSHGSWDMEYWKAWANEAATKGIPYVYGEPGSIPPGEFMGQLSGEIPRTQVSFRGREFPIDYPPLSLAAWGASWRFFTAKPRPYRGAEAENVAVKFPPVFGDLMAVGLLAWSFRGRGRFGLMLASIYWCFPITWISSALLGFFDGFVAPFLLASLLLAPTAPFMGGVVFAVTCLIKPTAGIALPVLLIAAGRSGLKSLTCGGALATLVTALPYVLCGTLDTAIVHVGRIFTQDRISGGYANPWWIAGHMALVVRGQAHWTDAIDYARRDSFDAPLGLVGFAAMAIVAARIVFLSRRASNPRALAYVAAILLFAWGVLTVGAHDNHNHPLFLLLIATGLGTVFLRVFSVVAATSTLLGSLCLHGLGRFYGAQWKAIVPWADWVAGWRMALGFDLTFALAIVNTTLLVVAVLRLRETLASFETA